MRLSKKSDYALRALVTLAERGNSKPVSIRVLSRGNDIPYRFLQQITLEMKEKNWIKSIPGRDGGIMLAKPPEAISMGEVVRYFDGVLAPVGCVSTAHYEPCSQESICRFRRALLEIRNYTAQTMDATTLAMLAAGHPLRNEEVFEEDFIGGAGI